jgi:integrase
MPDATNATPSQILKDLVEGKFTVLCKIKPSGTLQARRQANDAIIFYWRYSIGNKSERVSIGQYDAKSPPKSLSPTANGFSFAAAIRRAEELAEQHYQNKDAGGRPALLAAKKQAEEEAEKKSIEVSIAKKLAEKHTLKKLLQDYCSYLEKQGRRSHSDARSIFGLHVVDAWPKQALQAANTIQAEQIAEMMQRLTQQGKGRTANKLRSYMRAAYQIASKARLSGSIPAHFKDFQVRHNPANDTIPDASHNQADKNPLKTAQMRLYWQTIKKLPGFKGAALRLHLLTGGQRIEQLTKLRTTDIEPDLIVIYDGKGRPGKKPRKHTVPLTKLARAALDECKPRGGYALSTDGGTTRLSATTLSAWAVEAAMESKELEGFQAKRIRSGVETLLAAAGVSEENRGRLQSHGVSGIQSTHYNDHDYHTAKLEALSTLLTELEQPIHQPVKRI